MEKHFTIETYMNKQKITVTFKADIHRELTENEKHFMTESCDVFLRMVYKNNQLNDPSFLKELQDEKSSLVSCFEAPIYIKEIYNEYNSENLNPWLLVTTHKGVIKIGWRKRVINIDWSGSDIKSDSETLFPNEDTTKFDKTIHAWGYEKASEYIHTLLSLN